MSQLTVKEARKIIGHASGLGKPSKMPGYSTSLPASACKVGAKLRKVAGSVCASCYAFKGRYIFPSVQLGLSRRLTALDNPRWADAMSFLIDRSVDKADPFFRIHDSGDFQSLGHVKEWVKVARANPGVNFWAPSRETRMIKAARMVAGTTWPSNLVIRLSAPMVGQQPAKGMQGYPTSTVDGGQGHQCPAPTQGNQCGSCRACWDPTVANIDYHKH
mgnify:FL=1